MGIRSGGWLGGLADQVYAGSVQEGWDGGLEDVSSARDRDERDMGAVP